VNCEKIKLTYYLIKSGEASADEASEFESHLQQCRKCSHEFTSIEKTLNLYSAEKSSCRPPERARSEILSSLPPKTNTSFKNKILQIAYPAAAAAVVVISLGVIFRDAPLEKTTPTAVKSTTSSFLTEEALPFKSNTVIDALINDADDDISSVNSLLAKIGASPSTHNRIKSSPENLQINQDALDVINDFQQDLLSISPYSDS
jgi:flagellin-like hook-associated protein FlgL